MKPLLLLLFAANAHAMVKPTPKNKRAAHPITDPTSYTELTKDLRVAIRDINFTKTQTTLNFLKQLNKKQEDLRCLELEMSTYVVATKNFYEIKAAEIAKCAAHRAISRQNTLESPKNDSETISQAAVLDHAHAIAIHDMVLDFFRQEYQNIHCSHFALTPPPHQQP